MSKLSSMVKSWLYMDTLEKPEELVLFKSRKLGGLGMHDIKSKSTAILIKSFLETAVSAKFTRNSYHHALFKWHVLGHQDLKDPGKSPYYSQHFFSIIKEAIIRGKRLKL